MIEKINDSGQRISYGEGKAVREPTTGKGRYDLITPFGIDRLAKWYELGSRKYTKEFTLERQDVISVIQSELERIIGARNVVQIDFIAKTCVEAAMRSRSEKEIQNMQNGSVKMQTNGTKSIQSGLGTQQNEDEKIHIAESVTGVQNFCRFLKNEGSQKGHIKHYLNCKITDVESVEDLLMKLEPCILTMTIPQGEQEAFYVVDAITDLECLKNLLNVCKRLYPTFNILPQIKLSNQQYAITILGDRNWEKGIPFSRYIDSAKRHLNKFVMGMEDEDHLAAAAWNIFAIMHHEELEQTNLDDMPHYLRSEKHNEV